MRTHTFVPITRDDALTCDAFHAGPCTVTYGATGKARPTVTSELWRRNGRTRTWKRDPSRVEVPIKHGMYAYGTIDAHDIARGIMHRADTCPVAAEAIAWWDAKHAPAS
jgi:hypothetical protein